jgi:large subunit ribosomal protein L29
MKIADIRALSTPELQTKINDAREEYRNLRFQQATGELTDFTRIPQTRRLIARLTTVLNERERTAKEGEL